MNAVLYETPVGRKSTGCLPLQSCVVPRMCNAGSAHRDLRVPQIVGIAGKFRIEDGAIDFILVRLRCSRYTYRAPDNTIVVGSAIQNLGGSRRPPYAVLVQVRFRFDCFGRRRRRGRVAPLGWGQLLVVRLGYRLLTCSYHNLNVGPDGSPRWSLPQGSLCQRSRFCGCSRPRGPYERDSARSTARSGTEGAASTRRRPDALPAQQHTVSMPQSTSPQAAHVTRSSSSAIAWLPGFLFGTHSVHISGVPGYS